MKSLYAKYLLLVLILLVSQVAFAQKVSLSGRVLSASCGEPVKNVEVSLNKYNLHAKTDSNGQFLLADLSPESYQLMLNREGYLTYIQNIELRESTHLEFKVQEIEVQQLDVVEIREEGFTFAKDQLRQVEGTAIYAGKKSDLITLDKVQGNLAANSARQIYAKVAGLNIWESDGAGIQLDIGGRGLNPSRSSNFNIRQNGYDISADALGYPESYYTPPSEAIDQIEILRGAASLQYGTQFGGMINYRLKRGPEDKPFSLELRQTGGSYGFFNSFNAIGGTKDKFSYYAFYQYKRGNGWRDNSGFQYHSGHVHMAYKAHKNLSLTAEYTIMNYLAQQPGGLTDAQFNDDPTRSYRERNWFKVRWNLMAVMADWKISDRTKLNTRFFGLLAERNALGFLGLISRADPLEERDLIKGTFQNFGNETRLIYRYYLGGNISNFLVGVRSYFGYTQNKQGLAGDGYDADFTYLNPNNLENSSYSFPSKNVAVFAENIFTLHPKLSITPGIRFEYIKTVAEGYYREQNRDLAGNIIFDNRVDDNRTNPRTFVLAGVGISYKPTDYMELYGNFSQNYRAITFNDMRIFNPNFRIDPNLQDERGYTLDLGYRGSVKNWLSYDLSAFLLKYDDRIGEILLQDTVLYNVYRYRTNVSDSRTVGLELYTEIDLIKLWVPAKTDHSLSVYVNFSWQHARYDNSAESAFKNKQVELVPEFIVRTGVQYKWKQLKLAWQSSYTSRQYTDATNAEYSPTAINGIIPSYFVMDVSASYTIKQWSVSAGVNNLLNNSYFTRRATGYPGPGIIPADPLNFFVTLGFKL